MAYIGSTIVPGNPELESVRRLREAGRRTRIKKSKEALSKQHKKSGMLKVAQKHEDEGRPEVAAKIRRKAIAKFGS